MVATENYVPEFRGKKELVTCLKIFINALSSSDIMVRSGLLSAQGLVGKLRGIQPASHLSSLGSKQEIGRVYHQNALQFVGTRGKSLLELWVTILLPD